MVPSDSLKTRRFGPRFALHKHQHMQRGIHSDPKDAVGCRYRVRSGIVALLALLVATTSACRQGKTDVRAKLESAESFFVAGDYGSAEVEYKNVLRAALPARRLR